MKGLCKVWCEISDETSGANLAKWKKKEPCASYSELKEWAPGAFSCSVTHWHFDVSYFAAHKLIYQQLRKPIHISFIRMSSSLLGAMFSKLSFVILTITCLCYKLHT